MLVINKINTRLNIAYWHAPRSNLGCPLSRHVIVGRKNKMLHLRLKAYLQAFMLGKEKVHGDVTILCSSSLPSSDISMHRCGFLLLS
jgi:hypothetical protein